MVPPGCVGLVSMRMRKDGGSVWIAVNLEVPGGATQSLKVGPGGLQPALWLVVHGDQLLLRTGEPVALWVLMSLQLGWGRAWGTCGSRVQVHLHHIHEVAKADGLIYGQVAVAVQHTVVEHFLQEAHAQHVVTRMPH